MAKKVLAKRKSSRTPVEARTPIKGPVPFVSTGYWLLKSEPEAYSIDTFARDGKTLWTGVRNYQARNFMTSSMKPGDRCLFYHSNAEPSAVAGEGRVLRTNLPDPTALDSTSEYYDPKASYDHPIWFCAEIGFTEKYKRILPLAKIREIPELSSMRLLQRGQRLSILPLTEKEYKFVREYCTGKPVVITGD